MKHAFSVDVEDWYQSTLSGGGEVSDRFEPNVMKVLAVLAEHGVRATFFVLGGIAAASKHVIRAIADAGHEVQSHGFAHRSNFLLDEKALREDLLRAKSLLEDVTGREVYGYRAPYWTIDERNLWVYDVLAETGHRYSSSVWPKRRTNIADLGVKSYGMDGCRLEPHVVTAPGGRRIVEAPPMCVRWMGRLWPMAGGGYFRLWPGFLIRHLWSRLERQGRPGVLYIHPYEYDPGEMAARRGSVSLKRRIHQGLGRKRFPRKIDRLLRAFQFTSLAEVLGDLLALLP